MDYCDKGIYSSKPLVIVKSDFWENENYGSIDSLPDLTLPLFDGKIPFLYGENKIIRKANQIVIYADLIASSFFLLSRYDEAFAKIERDKYGRPNGRKSFKSDARILDRPIVDEYGEWLRTELKEIGYGSKEFKRLSHVFVTHDVDCLWINYTPINAIKTFLKDLVVYKKMILLRC